MLVAASMSRYRARRLLVQSVSALVLLLSPRLAGSVQDAIRLYRDDLSSFQLSFIPDMTKGVMARVAQIGLGPGAVTAEVDGTQPVGWTPRHDEVKRTEQPRVVISPPQVILDGAGIAVQGSRQRSDRVPLRSTEEDVPLVDPRQTEPFPRLGHPRPELVYEERRVRHRKHGCWCHTAFSLRWCPRHLLKDYSGGIAT